MDAVFHLAVGPIEDAPEPMTQKEAKHTQEPTVELPADAIMPLVQEEFEQDPKHERKVKSCGPDFVIVEVQNDFSIGEKKKRK